MHVKCLAESWYLVNDQYISDVKTTNRTSMKVDIPLAFLMQLLFKKMVQWANVAPSVKPDVLLLFFSLAFSTVAGTDQGFNEWFPNA